jgi:pyruvate dehydrogenase E1 component alpha subunit
MMGGWLFQTCGQEAISVAVRSLFGPLDHSISGHRGLGHAIAAGLPMGSLMAELCGRATGCSQGRGGAGGICFPENHFWGTSPVVASQTPVAAGLALHLKLHRQTGVVVCFLGDGAVNQGVYHETLNLAGLLQLPVVFMIENNRYAGGTSVARSSAFKESLARRADGYGIAYGTLDGHDVEAVRTGLYPWLQRAREQQLPAVLEIATYRFCGWSVADANRKKYSTEEERFFHETQRNPVRIQQERLLHAGILTEDDVKEIRLQARAEARSAVSFALEGRFLRAEEIMDHVYETR